MHSYAANLVCDHKQAVQRVQGVVKQACLCLKNLTIRCRTGLLIAPQTGLRSCSRPLCPPGDNTLLPQYLHLLHPVLRLAVRRVTLNSSGFPGLELPAFSLSCLVLLLLRPVVRSPLRYLAKIGHCSRSLQHHNRKSAVAQSFRAAVPHNNQSMRLPSCLPLLLAKHVTPLLICLCTKYLHICNFIAAPFGGITLLLDETACMFTSRSMQ